MITTVWLIDTIDRAMAPQMPEVRNAEGDELLFFIPTVHLRNLETDQS